MSKVLPSALQNRPDLNLRQGIKSSLNKWRQLLATLYLFQAFGGKSYCKEVQSRGTILLDLDDQFARWLTEKWNAVPNVVSRVKGCSLYSAQLEHLQVGLGLFLKLAKVNFVDNSIAEATERCGGNRFAKCIRFSTNMKLLVDTINLYSETDRRDFVDQWLSGVDDSVVSKRVKEVLAPFTEECQYKIRTAVGEISFQEDGVYSALRNNGDTVESSDTHEPVGPFRILKSYVKEGMHPYISDTSNGFSVKTPYAEFSNYADMVRTTLDLLPKRTTVYQEVSPAANQQTTVSKSFYQRITYGAPGTGKSHEITKDANEKNSIRVTFHPDTDYSAFIGAYKPTMERAKYDTIIQVNEIVKDVNGVESVISKLKAVRKDEIVYSFVPQAFMKAYVKAWRRWCDGSMSDDDKVFYLVIEEINRGNCAQIFGDAFQLLDRCKSGFSSYAIAPDNDIERFLREDEVWNLSALALTADVTNDDGKVVATVDQIKRGERMVLPPNLRIWATMNTSDQSLFPMDSAFKRRWDWEYMPIKDEKQGYKIKVGADEYDWWSFLDQINDVIAEHTSSEDKQLGYFFARPKEDGQVIKADDFVSKVIFYLWKEVFKDDLPQTNPFKYTFKEGENEREIRFTDFYKDDLKGELVKHFLDELGVEKVKAQTEQTATTEGAGVVAEGAATPTA